MDKRELISKLEQVKRDIAEYRNRLDNIKKVKEILYQKRNSLRDNVRNQIKDIKDLKSRKDKDNIGLQEGRNEKELLNKGIRELIIKIKEINEKRKKFRENKNLPRNPNTLKSTLERLESRIETEAVSYEEEKKLMKKINQLKKEYNSLKGFFELNDEYNKISAEIDSKKARLEKIRHKFKDDLIKGSNYDDFMNKSKNILETKKEISDVNEEYMKLKADYLKTSLFLKEKLMQLSTIINDLDFVDKKILEDTESKKKYMINKKALIVEEKIKNGQKLSTEDLITFQANK